MAKEQFLELIRGAVSDRSLEKLTLGKYRGTEPGLQNLFVRPVQIKAGQRLAFVWRFKTRDVTKNHEPEAAVSEIGKLLERDFLDAHLFTPTQTVQLTTDASGRVRLRTIAVAPNREKAADAHDREKARLIPPTTPWLTALGVTNEQGRPRELQADKFRQINRFAEILLGLVDEAFAKDAPLRVVDMGCGKGYLTFALATVLGDRATIRGVEARPELVDLTNQVAVQQGLGSRLTFQQGSIADIDMSELDVLVALHACDTATDDALARGIAAGARLIVVAPCCQKELRPQIRPPDVLTGALRHGIFQERQAEFVTDALRAELLEWAGYRTKVLEFISTEHTAKNLMIAAVQVRPHDKRPDPAAARVRGLAAFYSVRKQRLAEHLGFSLQ